MIHWSNAFLALPHADLGRDRTGCDCYGLLWLVYRDVLGIALPTYVGGYADTDEVREIDGLITGASQSATWQAVDGVPAAFDVVTFARGNFISHLGVVVEPGMMLHQAEGRASRIESYRTGLWSKRLRGFYRHVEAASRSL